MITNQTIIENLNLSINLSLLDGNAKGERIQKKTWRIALDVYDW
jgi:hypothetical protein